MWKKVVSLCFCLALLSASAWASNGFLLHGIGVVNSTMGGAGAGLPMDVIGALHANPALLTQLEDYHVGLSFELFENDLDMTAPNGQPPFTGPSVTTDSDNKTRYFPAAGFSIKKPGSKYAFGFGAFTEATFSTNWPVDPTNLILAPQPLGFGSVSTGFEVTKIPFALAWQANSKLSLGFSANFYISELVINPLPRALPDCNLRGTNQVPPAGTDLRNPNLVTCYRPYTGIPVTEFAFALQAGLYYEISSRWSVGAAYTTERDTDAYRWSSQHANPNLPDFGFPREIEIELDQPPIASLGIGFRPNPKLRIAVDVRRIFYNSTDGIGGPGGINMENRAVSIAWQDMWVGMIGLELDLSPTVSLRAGVNYNDSQILSSRITNSGGTPEVYQEHYSLGMSIKATSILRIDIGAYISPENSKTGPFANFGDLTFSNSITSALFGFSYEF